MAALLALAAAVAYGASDFSAGVASRRFAAGPVAAAGQIAGLISALVALLIFRGSAPDIHILAWGAASGVGSGVGTLSLYRGLAVGRMSVVATLSALLTVAIPALVGVALGNRLSTLNLIGVVAAVPAIGLVSWHSAAGDRRRGFEGLIYGAIAGCGFALLFIALDLAGTRAASWPLVPGQAISILIVAPFGALSLHTASAPGGTAIVYMIGAAILTGVANLLFLASTGRGELAVVAVLSAMYPAVTVLLARLLLKERWSRVQAAGLVLSGVAVVLVALK